MIEIVSISPCPDISSTGPGTVRATYETHGVQVVDLWVEGAVEPIGVTTNHPLYSLDRQAWVDVGDLWIGERLQTQSGDEAVVEYFSLREGKQVVYNFEVHGHRTYYVGSAGLWAHNGGPETPRPPAAPDVKSVHDLPHDYHAWPSKPTANGKGIQYTDPDGSGRNVREMEPVTHHDADPKKKSPTGYTRYSDGYGGKPVLLESRRSRLLPTRIPCP